jgi:hypothetical protein
MRRELQDIVKLFLAVTRLRNELSHATYVVNDIGEITHTQVMKLEERRGEMRFGTRQALDAERLEEIAAAVQDLYRLNRRLWALLPRLAAAADASRDG